MSTVLNEERELRVSQMAEQLVGSEIIKLAGEVKSLIAQGATIHNFTIGDFDSSIFPIPTRLKEEIITAYQEGHTNYPASNGIEELRVAISAFIEKNQGLSYSADEFLVSGGARPLIYATYQALVDPDDKVIFPVPSWNNNHYTHLTNAQKVMIDALPENNFMPVAEDLKAHIQDAALIALCSPLNPTGTVFSREQLEDIVALVLEENKRRGPDQKPLYLMYDQIYWQLTYGVEHVDPVSIDPAMRPYTVYIDGISKVYAATGVRVGWAFGPKKIMDKMKAILGHIGAWSPKAEQVATSRFLGMDNETSSFLSTIKEEIRFRLDGLYTGLKGLKEAGFNVNVIPPQAALYLTLQIDLIGATTASGQRIEKTEDITSYILNEAGIALVPFYAFGTPRSSTWYRLSVGTCQRDSIDTVIAKLRTALESLSYE